MVVSVVWLAAYGIGLRYVEKHNWDADKFTGLFFYPSSVLLAAGSIIKEWKIGAFDDISKGESFIIWALITIILLLLYVARLLEKMREEWRSH